MTLRGTGATLTKLALLGVTLIQSPDRRRFGFVGV